jgi:hypothetical protein
MDKLKILVLFALENSFAQDRPAVILDNLISQKNNSTKIDIAWGSCYGVQDKRTDIFKSISQPSPPDLFIWGGDATYVDTFTSFLYDDETGVLPVSHISN